MHVRIGYTKPSNENLDQERNMKQTLMCCMLLAACGYLATSASAQERKLALKDLPAKVRAAVDRERAGATIKGFATEKENGRTTYEAELVVDGRGKDISMDANGNVLEIEEEVSMDSLPESVRNALMAQAAGGKIGKVESLTKKGNLVAYETVVTTGKKHREIQVGPNGEKLGRAQ